MNSGAFAPEGRHSRGRREGGRRLSAHMQNRFALRLDSPTFVTNISSASCHTRSLIAISFARFHYFFASPCEIMPDEQFLFLYIFLPS